MGAERHSSLLVKQPARFTVQVVDMPVQVASYEFCATALYQNGLQE